MKHRSANNIALNIIGIAVFICLWQLLVIIKQDPTLVSADKIANKLIEIIISKEFAKNLLSTIKIVAIGIAISIVFAIILTVLMDLNNNFKQIVLPIIEICRNIPSITLFPILLIIYGIGDTARIFVIFWTSYPSILLSMIYGMQNIPQEIVEASASCGANKYQTMLYIKMPLTTPDLLNGIKIGIGSGFVAIVVAEMLGASKGLGFMVLWSTNSFKYAETYSYILIIGCIGALLNLIMEKLIEISKRKAGRD